MNSKRLVSALFIFIKAKNDSVDNEPFQIDTELEMKANLNEASLIIPRFSFPKHRKTVLFFLLCTGVFLKNIFPQDNNDIYKKMKFATIDKNGIETVVVDGDDITSIYKTKDTFRIAILFAFTDTGSNKLAESTAKNIKNEMHIYFDDELITSGTIMAAIEPGDPLSLSSRNMKNIVNVMVEKNILPPEDYESIEDHKIGSPIIINSDNADSIQSYENAPVSIASYYFASRIRKDDLYKKVTRFLKGTSKNFSF